MNSPSTRSSPSYKNLRLRNKQSPIEIKEKLRKSYKEKVHSCRNILINSLRGVIDESNVRNTLQEIYKSTFDSTDDDTSVEEEKMLAEIQEELVKEELDWWLEEYEKGHTENIDWNAIEADNVICPVCQKVNFTSENGNLSCALCNIEIKTEKSLPEVKKLIFSSVEKHGSNCCNDTQFIAIPDTISTHIYLMCSMCNDIQIII